MHLPVYQTLFIFSILSGNVLAQDTSSTVSMVRPSGIPSTASGSFTLGPGPISMSTSSSSSDTATVSSATSSDSLTTSTSPTVTFPTTSSSSSSLLSSTTPTPTVPTTTTAPATTTSGAALSDKMVEKGPVAIMMLPLILYLGII